LRAAPAGRLEGQSRYGVALGTTAWITAVGAGVGVPIGGWGGMAPLVGGYTGGTGIP
jgi:hypothetical protein